MIQYRSRLHGDHPQARPDAEPFQSQEFELGCRIVSRSPTRTTLSWKMITRRLRTQTSRAAMPWPIGQASAQPTLFADNHFGVGKDYSGPMTTAAMRMTTATLCSASPTPSSCVINGRQFGRNCQWAFSIYHEFDMGGELERETGFNQALVYSIRDEYLKVGLESQFIYRTDADPQSGRNTNSTSARVSHGSLPSSRGSTLRRSSAPQRLPCPQHLCCLFHSFGDDGNKGEKGENVAPVSTQHR